MWFQLDLNAKMWVDLHSTLATPNEVKTEVKMFQLEQKKPHLSKGATYDSWSILRSARVRVVTQIHLGEFSGVKSGLRLQCSSFAPAALSQCPIHKRYCIDDMTPIKFGAECSLPLFCLVQLSMWQLLATVYSQLLVSQSSSVGRVEAVVQYQFWLLDRYSL